MTCSLCRPMGIPATPALPSSMTTVAPPPVSWCQATGCSESGKPYAQTAPKCPKISQTHRRWMQIGGKCHIHTEKSVCTNIHTHTHIYIYIYMYIYYIYIFIYLFSHIVIHIYIYISMFVCVCAILKRSLLCGATFSLACASSRSARMEANLGKMRGIHTWFHVFSVSLGMYCATSRLYYIVL